MKNFQRRNQPMLLPDFTSLRVAVIGDAMLDEYYDCSIDRISPEAPVIIARTDLTRKKVTLGGAANTAKNCAGLGANVTLFSVVGEDKCGQSIRTLCLKNKIKTQLFSAPHINTIRKVRYRQHHHQIIRIDYENSNQPYKSDSSIYYCLISSFTELINNFDLVILSDYNKGTLNEDTCQKIIYHSRNFNLPIFVDPKGTLWSKYEGATCLTPNFNEFKQMTDYEIDITNNYSINVAAKDILRDFCLDYMLITKGEHGINYIGNDNEWCWEISDPEEVYDVSGAGDTVISVFAMSIISKFYPLESVKLANIAAGIVIKKSGTQSIEFHELEEAVKNKDCSI